LIPQNHEDTRHRLFFALFPDDHGRAAVEEVIERLVIEDRLARRVPADRWHVTLVFLGSVPSDAMTCVKRAAAGVHCKAFDLTLDRMGYWRRSQVLWLGSTTLPPELDDLVSALRAAIGPCAIGLEDRPFKPHVTVVRGLRRRPPPTQIAPVTWHVARFALMESLSASAEGYREVGSWTLQF
jgi:2'-5' RNA ligase